MTARTADSGEREPQKRDVWQPGELSRDSRGHRHPPTYSAPLMFGGANWRSVEQAGGREEGRSGLWGEGAPLGGMAGGPRGPETESLTHGRENRLQTGHSKNPQKTPKTKNQKTAQILYKPWWGSGVTPTPQKKTSRE